MTTHIGGGGEDLWVADTGNSRVQELRISGSSVIQVRTAIGSAGTGNGQFSRPTGIALDASGDIWVTDTGNDRVEEFNSTGHFLAQNGTPGSGSSQFSRPVSITAGQSGALWIVDGQDGRLQEWRPAMSAEPEEAPPSAPPAAAVSSAGGEISAVAVSTGQEYTYHHSGKLLTSVSGPDGETKYIYNSSDEMTKVELPHSTWAEISYNPIGQVTSVTESVEGGSPSTTHFAWSSSPRTTVVEQQGHSPVTYEIGADGSILKSWSAAKAPEIEDLTGSLWTERGEIHEGEISKGDQTLQMKAYSATGVKSLQLIAGGDEIVAEKTCSQNYEV